MWSKLVNVVLTKQGRSSTFAVVKCADRGTLSSFTALFSGLEQKEGDFCVGGGRQLHVGGFALQAEAQQMDVLAGIWSNTDGEGRGKHLRAHLKKSVCDLLTRAEAAPPSEEAQQAVAMYKNWLGDLDNPSQIDPAILQVCNEVPYGLHAYAAPLGRPAFPYILFDVNYDGYGRGGPSYMQGRSDRHLDKIGPSTPPPIFTTT